MTPFVDYLQQGILPDIHDKARNVRKKALKYAILGEILYKKGFTTPWLKCVDEAYGRRVL